MLNKVILMGRLTADPELRQTSQGVDVCTIVLAVDRSYVKKGEERKADFLSVVCWRQTASFVAKTFKKGSLVAVEGSIGTRSYTNKNDEKRYVTEIYADNIYFTGERVSTDADADTSVADTNVSG